MNDDKNNKEIILKHERLCLAFGITIGQLSALLKYIKTKNSKLSICYKSLLDIINRAELRTNELFYDMENKKMNPEEDYGYIERTPEHLNDFLNPNKHICEVSGVEFATKNKIKIDECLDHYIGMTVNPIDILGRLVNESERHLYFINPKEYLDFNFCPRCGFEFKKKQERK